MRKFYKQSSVAALLVAAFLLVGGASVQAQEVNPDQSSLQALQQQVQQLRERVSQLRDRLRSQFSNRRANEEATSTQESASEADSASAADELADLELEVGDRGEIVRQLQELLAQDESIYPEGLATGYYGQLTSQAVARLQQQIGVPDNGEINEQTIQRVRELIEDGAGNSGVTPPGLLHAPGIQRFFSADNSTTTEDTEADDDEAAEEDSDNDDEDEQAEEDRRQGPDIENLSIPERIKEKLRGIFSNFRDDREDDDDDEEDELEIEAEAEDGVTEVEVEYSDGTEEEFSFDTMDRSEVISRLVEETDLTESDIEAVLEFETDDEADEDDEEDDDDSDDDDSDE